MKCEQVQASLLFYLDGELAPGDHQAVAWHIAGCHACQQALAALTATRRSLSRALQNLADEVEVPPLALSQLHSRLAKEARPSPAVPSRQDAHRAPGAHRTQSRFLPGASLMRKRILLPASLAVVVIAFLAFFWARNVTPVSAQQILSRASAFDVLSQSAQGIEHVRTEMYSNITAEAGDQAGTSNILESYFDRQNGKLRLVTITAVGGQVLSASGYDGFYTYSTRQPEDGSSSPLVIYRSPQPNANLDIKKTAPAEDPGQQARQVFDQFRSSPDVKLVGKQTLADGRTVYVLRIAQEVKVINNKQMEHTPGFTWMTFDANTYAMLENRTTIQKDGKEVAVVDIHYLANELLPADARVAWDMSDLQGVSIVDDPKGANSDLLPETLSLADLADRTSQGYVLQAVPDGFELEITAPAKQDPNQPYIYIASYRNPAEDYFVIQASEKPANLPQAMLGDESYTTASGLTLNFGKTEDALNGKSISEAMVIAPDGAAFTITSTLPREQMKQLAEQLVVITK